MKRIIPYRLWYGALLPNWLLARPEVPHVAKLLYARLAQYGGKEGVAYPCHETLARELGVSRRTVQRGLEELAGASLLEVESGKAAGKVNRYHFLDHPWMHEGPLPSEQDVDVDAPGCVTDGAEVRQGSRSGAPLLAHEEDQEEVQQEEGARKTARTGPIREGGRRKAFTKGDALATERPPMLQAPEYEAAWTRWVEHLWAKKHPTPTQLAKHVADCLKVAEAQGAGAAARMLDDCIGHGAVGIRDFVIDRFSSGVSGSSRPHSGGYGATVTEAQRREWEKLDRNSTRCAGGPEELIS